MSVEKTIELLLAGEVVGFPTETVYGLAADITQSQALHRIFSTKERPFFDPLIVHIDTLEKARRLSSNWTPLHEALAQLWPGPLTIITDKNQLIDPLITAGLNQVALRIPRHPLALKVLSQFVGLAAPSANKFGKTSPTSASHVESEFAGKVYVLEGGPCEVGIESTVVAVKDEKTIEIYRPGFFSAQDLKLHLKDFNIKVTYAESPVAPGQLKHHYMPSIPVLVGHQKTMEEIIVASSLELKNPIQMSLGSDARMAARQFYQNLREFSSKGHDAIIVSTQDLHQKEEWLGLMNRLQKASSLWV